jgi:hydroxyacylglutathione hydrolase
MKINTFENGPFMVNTYLLEDNLSAIVIDPGHDIAELLTYTSLHNLDITHILITHGHIDHVAGLNFLKKQYPLLKSMIGHHDIDILKQISVQSRMFGLADIDDIKIDEELPDCGNFKCGKFDFIIYHVPGHSKGSLCFKLDNFIFTGDTLFAGAIGRSDLFGGNHNQLIQNIREKLLTLSNNTVIYPGHGEKSTIGIEKKNNPYL